MSKQNIKYILTLALFIVLEFSFAQSDINRLDRYSHIWTRGNECLVLEDGNILLAGKASDTIAQQQSFHLSLHNENGNILNTNFIYDSIDPLTVGFQKNMTQISENEIFYCYQGRKGDCFYYDLDDFSIYNMNAFGYIEEDSTYLVPYVIKNINDTLIISGRFVDNKTNQQSCLITKIKDKQLLSRTIINYPDYDINTHIGRAEIFCINSNNYFAYIYTDQRGPYLYHIVNDTLQNIITIDPDYYLHSAYFNEENNIILSAQKLTEEGNIRYKSMVIAEIDLEGNTIWENELESYIDRTVCYMNEVFYSTCLQTYVDRIIPAVDGDGYIYIGSEHVSEGSDQYSNAIIGKINLEGNVLWNHRYRYYDTVPGYNGFHDIEPDQYGGYIVYGDIIINDFSIVPFFTRAWLMRVDVDGLMIDTTTNTTDPILQGYHDFNVSPNPALSSIQLSKSLSNLSVLDINGQVVMNVKGDSLEMIDVSELMAGVYIIVGQGSDDKWYRAKFVKE